MAFAVRGKTVWLPPLLLFVSILLLSSFAFAIAHLDRGEEALPPALPTLGGDQGPAPFGPTSAQFQLVWQIVIATIFILAIASAVISILTKQKTISVWELLGYGFGIGVIGGLVIFWPLVVAWFQSLALPGGTTGSTGSGGASTSGPIPVSTAFPIAVVIFSIAVIAVYVFALSSRIFPALIDAVHRGEPTRERRRLEAASAVRRTLIDLEAGTDFRTAVMACYQRMCSLIAARGVARQEALTAREIEGLALAELGLSQGSVDDLTNLFEEARYSMHEIGAMQRDRAMDCLTAIRRELEG